MKVKSLFVVLTLTCTAPSVHAQFGSGIVYDPTQSAHAAQQIVQAKQLYTNTVQATQNVIAAYNLARQMASLPQSLYSSYVNLGRQQWTNLTQPANTYGNSLQWINAALTANGAAGANQAASIQRIARIAGYGSLSSQGQQSIAAQGATVDLSDSANASSLQTIGTIR